MCLKSGANLPETTQVSVRFIYGRNRRFWRGVGANERRSKMLKLSGTLKTFAKGTTLAVAIGAAGLAFSAAPVAAQMHRPSAGFHADRGGFRDRDAGFRDRDDWRWRGGWWAAAGTARVGVPAGA
jgi:hypothetical protein